MAEYCSECWHPVLTTTSCNNRLIEVTIEYYNDNSINCNDINTNRQLMISYIGSTIAIDGPTEIISSTLGNTKFYINIPDTACATDRINIALINPDENNFNEIIGCISDISVQIDCPCDESSNDTPGGTTPEPGIPEDTDCCTYFNDNYVVWEYTNCIDFFSDYPAKY